MENLKEYLFKAQLLNDMFKSMERSIKSDIEYETARLDEASKEYDTEYYTKELQDSRTKLNVLKNLEQDIINNLIR